MSDPRPPRNHALGAAFLSVLFGTAAIVFAVAPLIPGATGGRFVISTVGLTAVFAGFRSFHLRRGRPAMGASVLSTIGIGSGAFATLLMVVTWASFQSVPGLVAQPLPQRTTSLQAAEPPVPAPEVKPASASLAAMEQTLGTLAFAMRRTHAAGTAWPVALQVSADGAVSAPGYPGVLVRLPIGTRLGYRTSTDGSAYAVRISDTSDPQRYVDYDSNSGVVAPSPVAPSEPST